MGCPRLQPLPEQFTLLLVEAVLAARRDRDRRERFVDFPQGDVAGRQSGAVQHLDRAQTAVAGRHARGGPGLDGAHHLELLRLGVVAVDQRHSRRGVIGAAAVAGHDRETLDSGVQHLQAGELLDGDVAPRGCPSTANSVTEPSSWVIFNGSISLTNLPASMAAMAR